MNEADFYDEDVIEAANLAIAIHKDDYTTSIELSLSCENLPKMDTFSLTDPMIIVKMEKEEKEFNFIFMEILAFYFKKREKMD